MAKMAHSSKTKNNGIRIHSFFFSTWVATGVMDNLRFEDAVKYIDEVKVEFEDQPQAYHEFLYIMKAYKAKLIDTRTVTSRVCCLFQGNIKLIAGFNIYLPSRYKIDIPTRATGDGEDGGPDLVSSSSCEQRPMLACQPAMPILATSFPEDEQTRPQEEAAMSGQSDTRGDSSNESEFDALAQGQTRERGQECEPVRNVSLESPKKKKTETRKATTTTTNPQPPKVLVAPIPDTQGQTRECGQDCEPVRNASLERPKKKKRTTKKVTTTTDPQPPTVLVVPYPQGPTPERGQEVEPVRNASLERPKKKKKRKTKKATTTTTDPQLSNVLVGPIPYTQGPTREQEQEFEQVSMESPKKTKKTKTRKAMTTSATLKDHVPQPMGPKGSPQKDITPEGDSIKQGRRRRRLRLQRMLCVAICTSFWTLLAVFMTMLVFCPKVMRIMFFGSNQYNHQQNPCTPNHDHVQQRTHALQPAHFWLDSNRRINQQGEKKGLFQNNAEKPLPFFEHSSWVLGEISTTTTTTIQEEEEEGAQQQQHQDGSVAMTSKHKELVHEQPSQISDASFLVVGSIVEDEELNGDDKEATLPKQ